MRTGLITFSKAQVSAGVASGCDFALAAVLANCAGIYYVTATCLGTIAGGIINCTVNYLWVFQARECSKRNVALKYALVWAGSIFLNTWGTWLLTEIGANLEGLFALFGNGRDHLFLLSRIIVGVLVAVLWNYQLQRLFVYRNISLKRPQLLKKEKYHEL